MNIYPPERRFVYKEYAENYRKAQNMWRYADNFAYDGPQFVLLSPNLAAVNQDQSASYEIEFKYKWRCLNTSCGHMCAHDFLSLTE